MKSNAYIKELIEEWKDYADGEWRKFAACIDSPSDWFVNNENPPAEALLLCEQCAVADDCREQAPEKPSITVLYGGKVIKGTRSKNHGGRPRIYPCGTPQGRRRHERAGEPYCRLCDNLQKLF